LIFHYTACDSHRVIAAQFKSLVRQSKHICTTPCGILTGEMLEIGSDILHCKKCESLSWGLYVMIEMNFISISEYKKNYNQKHKAMKKPT
jgi:hypothetical protein